MSAGGRAGQSAEDTGDGSVWLTVLRVARHTAQTAVIAGLVLAPQGLGTAQVAWLACGLGVLFNALPVAAANLLRRRRRPAG